jgi:hypothetical protein
MSALGTQMLQGADAVRSAADSRYLYSCWRMGAVQRVIRYVPDSY